MSNKYIAKLIIMADTDYSSYYANLPVIEDKVNLQTNVVEAPLNLNNTYDEPELLDYVQPVVPVVPTTFYLKTAQCYGTGNENNYLELGNDTQIMVVDKSTKQGLKFIDYAIVPRPILPVVSGNINLAQDLQVDTQLFIIGPAVLKSETIKFYNIFLAPNGLNDMPIYDNESFTLFYSKEKNKYFLNF
jgi:hypothetical protein